MAKIPVYNLTCFRQHIEDPDLDIEIKPRLRLPAVAGDWDEMKALVVDAASGVPVGAHVLVDDFGPYVALIQDLGDFRLLFPMYDLSKPKDQRIVGVTAFRGFRPGERYEVGYRRLSQHAYHLEQRGGQLPER